MLVVVVKSGVDLVEALGLCLKSHDRLADTHYIGLEIRGRPNRMVGTVQPSILSGRCIVGGLVGGGSLSSLSPAVFVVGGPVNHKRSSRHVRTTLQIR